MRSLILTPGIVGKDGVSRLSRQVALSIADIQHVSEVEVWSLADDDNDEVPELSLEGISVRGARSGKLRLASWSATSLFERCHDLLLVVMHAHLGPLALPFHARGARVVQLLLGIEVWKPLTRLQVKAFQSAEKRLSISAHSARLFSEANPGLGSTEVCHPGISPVVERIGDAEPGDDGFALMVGRMASAERYKGHDLLLEVWPSVLEAIPDATLTIVGGGDDRARLIDEAHTRGLSDVVRFPGEVSEEELERLYRRCSFFVMPSTNEGFGLVFLEAMREGKACVGGVGAASEIIEHGTTGYVVDRGDTASVSRALVELFGDPERRAKMGRQGRERFERHFTSDCFRQRLQEVLMLDGS